MFLRRGSVKRLIGIKEMTPEVRRRADGARRFAQRTALLLGFSLLVLAGCESPSALEPVSTQAHLINDLIRVVFVISAVAFAIVEGFLIYAVIRFSRKGDQRRESEVGRRMETTFFIAPAIVLAVVFFISILLLRFLTQQYVTAETVPESSTTPILKMKVIAHQWWWEFQYPDLNIVTADEMHIPLGTLVQVEVVSADVIHSFWVPQFAGKIDAIPGQSNHTAFTVMRPGVYHGQCSEFCGVQHAQMYFYAVAESQQLFDVWAKQQQMPEAASARSVAGRDVFMKGACISCHTVDGSAAKGTLGPNLTHFAARANFAGASQPNTPEKLAQWLADPQKLKPGNLMPKLDLTPEQINALVGYLQNLK